MHDFIYFVHDFSISDLKFYLILLSFYTITFIWSWAFTFDRF